MKEGNKMNQKIKRILIMLLAVTTAALLLSFTAGATIRGDVDEDGTVTPADARMALRMSVGLDKSVMNAETKVPYTDKEKDLADMDMDLTVSPEDARVILRTAVKTEKTVPYYAITNKEPPTCTAEGVNVRVNTTNPEDKTIQIVPALGHDFSVPISFTVRPTCTTQGTGVYKCSRCNETKTITGYVEHVWKEATCTAPKICENCGLSSGSALGHTTMLGVCSRCGQYQGLLLDYFNTKIKKPLNEGAAALKTANTVMQQKYSTDYYNKTITLGDSIPYYITAYNYYYSAYEACGDYKEFAKAKEEIYSICIRLLDVIYSGEITAENYNNTMAAWTLVYNEICGEKGRNASLKAITETFKDPGTSTTPKTDTVTPETTTAAVNEGAMG